MPCTRYHNTSWFMYTSWCYRTSYEVRVRINSMCDNEQYIRTHYCYGTYWQESYVSIVVDLPSGLDCCCCIAKSKQDILPYLGHAIEAETNTPRGYHDVLLSVLFGLGHISRSAGGMIGCRNTKGNRHRELYPAIPGTVPGIIGRHSILVLCTLPAYWYCVYCQHTRVVPAYL